jgi:hypothetical protein
MGQSVIPAENSEKRTAEWTDEEAAMGQKPIVLSGKAAVAFADMVLSPPPPPSPAMERAAALHRKMVVSE